VNDDRTESKKRQGERNEAASLQQKLRNYAKATNDDVSLVLVRYLNERFLYRLSVASYFADSTKMVGIVSAVWSRWIDAETSCR